MNVCIILCGESSHDSALVIITCACTVHVCYNGFTMEGRLQYTVILERCL